MFITVIYDELLTVHLFFTVGMVMALVEFCHKTSIESKAGKVNFSDAMKNKAKLALQGATDSGDVDAVRFYGDSSAL